MIKDKKYFDLARAAALTSPYPKIKIGCCIIKKNRILSVGTNLVKSHPMQKELNRYREIDVNRIHNNIHAEVETIIKCSQDLTNAVLYTYREDTHGHIRKSRPCPACMELLRRHGIKEIHYTTDDGYCQELLAD